MTKLAPRGRRAAATLVLSIAFAVALVLPAAGLAAEDPLLSFSPAPVGFAETTVGAQSQTQAVDVYNGSGSAVAVDGIGVEGADAGDFQLGSGNCGLVEPDHRCSVSVTFAPDSVGTKVATLSVKLKEAPEQTVQLEGEAVPAQLAFTPGGYDFGIQRVNRGEGSADFQLANVGEAPTQLSGLGIGGSDRNNFWTNGGDCSGGRWLAPGESCYVQVGFNPWDTISYEAQLQAYVSGATFSADLTGQGGRAIVEPTSGHTDFGSVTVGSAGAVETIVLVNHGNLPGNFFIGIVAGGDSGSFRLLDEDCSAAPVPPSGACTAHVRFVPQGVGAKLARLAFFGDDEGGAMALLSGEGAAPTVTLAPSGHGFGAQALGSKSAAHAFAVRNEGGAPLDLGTVAIAGAELDQFALAGDECTGATLAPGAECLVRVRFVPDSAGAKVATLRVGSESGAFSAALTGLGIDFETVEGSSPAAVGVSSAGRNRGERQRGRHRHFVRGDDVAGAKRQRPRRVKVRASAVPR